MVTNLNINIFLKILREVNLDTKLLLREGGIKFVYFTIDKFINRGT